MAQEELSGTMFTQMVLSGAHHLKNNAEKIDALNVFPVPDGDTGTNMNLSITSGADEVKKLSSENISEVAGAFSKGLLMGARGNSGVILSQLFRGFAKGMEKKETLSAQDLAGAFDNGVTTAYKAVMKPVEGTILTVAKDAAETAVVESETENDVIALMEKVIQEAKSSLKRTPDLLPVLKEVGVVDSGGQGLVTIYEGFLAALKGEEVHESGADDIEMNEMVNAEHHKIAQDFMDTSEIEYGYCTEFMVRFEADKLKEYPFDEEAFRNELSEYGDSLLVVSDDDLVKVHVHAEYPGEVMTLGQRFGSLTNMKIENMRDQHTAIVGDETKKASQGEKAEYGILTVAMGSGVKELFESLGATVVIEGGQTMNPSTQDITEAIAEANANNVLILPNNKNIVMAAEQAAELAEVNAAVIPTKTIPQGISSLLAFHPETEIGENRDAMEAAGKEVKSGQVTYAVRDTQIDGITIEKDHFMGLVDGAIKASNQDQLETVKSLLDDMITEDDEILTILQGEDATDDDVKMIEQYVEDKFDDIEIEHHKGNQPIYSFIFSVE
ncbi:DAK2 domain-containing protein [Lentibacillus sp. CBA3610]|uniref:DAK2 domain-containing protein n=1 Tax=Lentibacillus sp. CBA3610 TaxID=2518176 RepID=UPI0015962CD7|nr:DAK2 domain-containing protein [Lentibacillus sp. CBA3610]QKY68996.1 DAK2 domain-containing protein [Lentibacillus sp. CBA3610]